MRGRFGRVGAAASAALALGALLPAGSRAATPTIDACDWSRYGRDLSNSFAVPDRCTGIDPVTVRTLLPAWVVPARDSVSASPTVVDGVAYVGVWDGTFLALDAETGEERWRFVIDDRQRVAFGRIVSTAQVARFPGPDGASRKVVLFGGGGTMYALDADTGRKLASLDLDPRSEATKKAQADDPPQVEIESSPAVADVRVGGTARRRIFVGMDVHNRRDVGRTGLFALELVADRAGWRFDPIWKADAETGRVHRGRAGLTAESGKGFGCGGVWSSPAVDVARGLVHVGTSSCSHAPEAKAAGENFLESVMTVRADTGDLVWRFRPSEDPAEALLDDDFGASPNLFTTQRGRRLVGAGRKSAHYYALDPATGRPTWTVLAGQPGHAGDDFAVGGYIGTPAVQTDGRGRAVRIVGAQAIAVPDLGGDDVVGSLDRTTWQVKAIDPESGRILWVHRLAGPSYAAVSVARGVVFVPDTFTFSLQALDAATGLLLWTAPLPGPPSSAPVVVGDSVYVGYGTRTTDVEFKAFGGSALDPLAQAIGASPLSPLSGIAAFRLP